MPEITPFQKDEADDMPKGKPPKTTTPPFHGKAPNQKVVSKSPKLPKAKHNAK